MHDEADLRIDTGHAQRRARAVRLGIFCAVVSPFLVNGWINPRIAAQPLCYWSFELLTWLVLPLAGFMLARRHGGPTLAALGFSRFVIDRRSLTGLLALCALAAMLAPAFYALSERLAQALLGGSAMFSYVEVMPQERVLRLLVVLWFGSSAGFVEEALYRGYAWHLAANSPYPRTVYLVLGPLVFALVHWEGGVSSLGASWLYGFVAAAAFLGLRNLWPLVVGHCVTDFLAFS